MTRARAATLLAVLTGACADVAPARPQWTVALATDAPVPRFFDRLLLEVHGAAGPCTSCRRYLALDESTTWPLTFGVVAGVDSQRVRVRLYREGDVRADGFPEPEMAIDAAGVLPPMAVASRVGMTLRMACLGVPGDDDARVTCDPASRARVPSPSLGALGEAPAPGSWPPAASVPCPRAAPEGMVCIPGGLFRMGARTAWTKAALPASAPERLVALSPFALDVREVTVGEMRGLGHAVPEMPSGGNAFLRACTQAATDALADLRPVNCVSYARAAEVCATLGKRLPTEAEWEYAAGNLDAETPYPWGYDDDVCAHAVVGRTSGVPGSLKAGCPAEDALERPPALPHAGGHPKDVTALGVRDLGGNVAEWVAGGACPYGDEGWGAPSDGVHWRDPRCPPLLDRFGVRGGAWRQDPALARVGVRNAGALPDVDVGFRCAWSLGP